MIGHFVITEVEMGVILCQFLASRQVKMELK